MIEEVVEWSETVEVVLHEILHILGVSRGHFGFYLEFPIRETMMSDPSEAYYFRYEYPVDYTVEYFGHGRLSLTTPKLKEVAAKHFGCDDVVGVPMEDCCGSGTAGSHWVSSYALYLKCLLRSHKKCRIAVTH